MTELPTIGIEIELPWKTMLDRVDPGAAHILRQSGGFYQLDDIQRERVQKGFDLVDAQYRDTIQGVFGEDIEQRSDGYTEFAFTPKKHYEDILVVAEGLFNKGILEEDEGHPLHVTLGGIAAKNSSWLILMAAELSGGTSPARIVQRGTWSQKSKAGIRQRNSRELKLGQKVAIEMRSLDVQGLVQLETTLSISQRAGGLLLEKLSGGAAAASRWHDLREILMSRTRARGIDARTRWKNPDVDISPWSQVARALEDDKWVAGVRSDVSGVLL